MIVLRAMDTDGRLRWRYDRVLKEGLVTGVSKGRK